MAPVPILKRRRCEISSGYRRNSESMMLYGRARMNWRARLAPPGVSIPATDLLIAAFAKRHDAGLEHSDSDLTELGQP